MAWHCLRLLVLRPTRVSSLVRVISTTPVMGRGFKQGRGTGDSGKSSLFNNERRWKDDNAFQALGNTDELSSLLGVCRELAVMDDIPELVEVLTRLQCCLQDILAHLATPPQATKSERKKEMTHIDTHMVDWIHAEIDRFGDQLPPLQQFILSGGGPTSAHLQFARAVCRRAEPRGMDEVRYDRQLRLWGEEGQSSIARTSVCVLGSSALGTEILKNLVLAGVHSVCIVDSAFVDTPDLGQNFFLRESDIGRPRAYATIEYLKELNPAVIGHSLLLSPLELSDEDFALLLQFFVVVGTNLPEEVATRISSFLFARGVPFISARAYGLLGYIRIFVQEHTIANDHEENALPDLRIDQPLPKLLEMAEEADLETMTLEELRHTPYIMLYLIALRRYREVVGHDNAFPDTYAKRKHFLEILLKMRREGESGSLDAENFEEAKAAAARSMHKTEVPVHVKNILMDANCDESSKCVQPFWLICTGLRRFVQKHGVLPLSGTLPDMTSDTKRYTKIASIFHEKALSDAAEVFKYTQEVEKERGVANMISEDLCYRFCKNANGIRLQRGTNKDSPKAFQDLLSGIANSSEDDGAVSLAVWFLLLRAADKFHREKGRYPGTNGVPCTIDALDLKQRVVSVISASRVENPESIISQVPQNAIAEICRYGAGELHVIASLIGGIAAQEVIKLATNQYVPLDNTFIYDGHTQRSAVFRM
ncbi:putative ATP:cob(I)alamin adenosyltransferase [Ostertagia ostertagi]